MYKMYVFTKFQILYTSRFGNMESCSFGTGKLWLDGSLNCSWRITCKTVPRKTDVGIG